MEKLSCSGINDFNFVILHGYTEHNDTEFFPWLKNQLEHLGYKVQLPELPDTDMPLEYKQVEYVVKNIMFNERTILIGHSLGGVVAMKTLEKLSSGVFGLGLVAPGGLEKQFWTEDFEFDRRSGTQKQYLAGFDFEYDFTQITSNIKRCIILGSDNDAEYRLPWMEYLAKKLNGQLRMVHARGFHFTATEEPEVLKMALDFVKRQENR
ncbi:alpha/beta hydrolase [Candidatus Saccharibacteria bacterium]|nr:alpha/beta hydrolase [Candidatus Saccharibacteria bacterium]